MVDLQCQQSRSMFEMKPLLGTWADEKGQPLCSSSCLVRPVWSASHHTIHLVCSYDCGGSSDDQTHHSQLGRISWRCKLKKRTGKTYVAIEKDLLLDFPQPHTDSCIYPSHSPQGKARQQMRTAASGKIRLETICCWVPWCLPGRPLCPQPPVTVLHGQKTSLVLGFPEANHAFHITEVNHRKFRSLHFLQRYAQIFQSPRWSLNPCSPMLWPRTMA